MENDLFQTVGVKENKSRPLADLLRPQTIEEIVGQDHLLEEFGALKIIVESKNVPSLILWGPAGVGKTSIAKILAKITDANFEMISAINSGVADIRKIIENIKRSHNKKTILMIDEIHHFNKTQQDLFLPFIEDGTFILIATTTENPSFALNSALLSRCKVLTLNSLNNEALKKLLQRAEKFMEKKLPLNEEAFESLVNLAAGDARYLLNAAEELFKIKEKKILNEDQLYKIITKRSAQFDKKGEFHYNLISAFHKSLRGSDVDAALYYLARMLEAGQDPLYILRRLARFATEDIGLADPQALLQVMAAKENYDFLGSPEGDYAVSHATIYLATAPKSNASYIAHDAAIEAARASTHLHPPKHILNAPTKMMQEQGYHKGYIYDHDTKDCFSGQEYFPEELLKRGRPKFYEPNERGFERDIEKRLKYWEELRKKIREENKN